MKRHSTQKHQFFIVLSVQPWTDTAAPLFKLFSHQPIIVVWSISDNPALHWYTLKNILA